MGGGAGFTLHPLPPLTKPLPFLWRRADGPSDRGRWGTGRGEDLGGTRLSDGGDPVPATALPIESQRGGRWGGESQTGPGNPPFANSDLTRAALGLHPDPQTHKRIMQYITNH